MDFSLEYTKEQEEFAKEVREWLDKNIPKDLVTQRDPLKVSREQWDKKRELGRKLGAKGWLWPSYPREYGGGGLDMDHSFVLRQELAKRRLSLPPYYDSGRLAAPAILACGTEEQKKRFLPPIFRGEAITQHQAPKRALLGPELWLHFPEDLLRAQPQQFQVFSSFFSYFFSFFYL